MKFLEATLDLYHRVFVLLINAMGRVEYRGRGFPRCALPFIVLVTIEMTLLETGKISPVLYLKVCLAFPSLLSTSAPLLTLCVQEGGGEAEERGEHFDSPPWHFHCPPSLSGGMTLISIASLCCFQLHGTGS